MKKILEKPWTYILYLDNDKYILSVVCGSVAMFEINLVLDDVENAGYREQGEVYISQLAAAVRDAPKAYMDRHTNVNFAAPPV